ncbi:MAG: DUF58 domain-containing protein [Akkermansiaceae bacterium]
MSFNRRWLQRLLYRNYKQGSSIGYFVRKRIRPVAWMFVGAFVGSMMMGANLRQSQVVALSSLILGILAVGSLWAFFRRASVVAERSLPATGSVGDELSYSVEVTNWGKRSLHGVTFKEMSDDPRPTEWEFLNLKEPGEETRNSFDRLFAFYRWKWLNERGGRWQSLGSSNVVSLKPGESTVVNLTMLPRRRGLLKLENLRVELPDPFGLFQRLWTVVNEAAEVLVIPKRYQLPNLDLSGESDLKVGGETASTVRGEGGEFMGLREYRPGDSLRKIHWKAWARTGQAIVKQYEEMQFSRYGLVLDTSLKASGPELLEEAISVAASFVSTMDREQCLLDLMFVREQPEVYTAGRGVARADRLMEVLAKVEGSDEGTYESLLNLISRYAEEMTACVVVLCGWSSEREEFLLKLRRSGLKLMVYVIGVGDQPEEEGLAGVTWLRWDSVQEDLMSR